MCLRLDWCSYQAAKYAVEHWHYSRTLQPAKTAKIGVWEDDKFIGCVLFTPGSGPIGSPYGVTPFEVSELSRVALTAHKTPVSRILAIAVKMVRRTYPKLRLLVSYADPVQDHHGGIYQASGWIYTGTSEPSTVWVDEDGKIWHGRAVSPTGFKLHKGNTSRCKKTGTMAKTKIPGKHRYLMPLDDEMRRQIEPLRKPYPKRATSIENDAPASKQERGRCDSDRGAPSLTE